MKTQITKLSNITDLISVLMLSKEQFDMETIQACAEAEMLRTNVSFIPYDILYNSEDSDVANICMFDDVSDFFFDAINKMSINKIKIKNLVNLCMEGVVC